jgi:hypothetical protein
VLLCLWGLLPLLLLLRRRRHRHAARLLLRPRVGLIQHRMPLLLQTAVDAAGWQHAEQPLVNLQDLLWLLWLPQDVC